MNTLPEEKAMVAKYKHRPFALIAVDSDGSRSALRAFMKKNGVTWRMIVGGSTTGPIPTKWGIQAWPTMFVIDRNGVIRYKMEGDDDLVGKVRNLMGG